MLAEEAGVSPFGRSQSLEMYLRHGVREILFDHLDDSSQYKLVGLLLLSLASLSHRCEER